MLCSRVPPTAAQGLGFGSAVPLFVAHMKPANAGLFSGFLAANPKLTEINGMSCWWTYATCVRARAQTAVNFIVNVGVGKGLSKFGRLRRM